METVVEYKVWGWKSVVIETDEKDLEKVKKQADKIIEETNFGELEDIEWKCQEMF